MKKKVLIIAEAGINHNGSFLLAKKLVDKASQIGADIIKFQTFQTTKLVTKNSPKAAYMNKFTKNMTMCQNIKHIPGAVISF